jgi:hypothetical protein
MKTTTEFIDGNVDKTHKVPRENLNCYWIYTEKRLIDPRQPAFPIIRSRMVCFEPYSYKAYFQCSVDNQIGFMQAMGFSACSLVWDPTLAGAKELHEQVDAEKRAAWDGSELKAREARRKATIGDIEKLSK